MNFDQGFPGRAFPPLNEAGKGAKRTRPPGPAATRGPRAPAGGKHAALSSSEKKGLANPPSDLPRSVRSSAYCRRCPSPPSFKMEALPASISLTQNGAAGNNRHKWRRFRILILSSKIATVTFIRPFPLPGSHFPLQKWHPQPLHMQSPPSWLFCFRPFLPFFFHPPCLS